MKLVLDNGQEIELESDLPETAKATDVIVGMSVVDFEEDEEYMHLGSSPGSSSAARLGLGAFLYAVLAPERIDDVEE
ncbi:hypothetical protein [Rothia nasimurium]|uniref:hypothetical protein n=1 Tax=Rothia nasimurium TaxID=85336 RepID=UPI001F3130B3|nr:hypothetical protein [Rothia nasimurium]